MFCRRGLPSRGSLADAPRGLCRPPHHARPPPACCRLLGQVPSARSAHTWLWPAPAQADSAFRKLSQTEGRSLQPGGHQGGLPWMVPESFSKATATPTCPMGASAGLQSPQAPRASCLSWIALLGLALPGPADGQLAPHGPWHRPLGTTVAHLPPALGLVQVTRRKWGWAGEWPCRARGLSSPPPRPDLRA